jgi:hypothetical protein
VVLRKDVLSFDGKQYGLKLLVIVLVLGILLMDLPDMSRVYAASPYVVRFSTRNFGIQFLHTQPQDLSNPQHVTFSLTNGAALWYGIEVQSQPTDLQVVAADPLNDLVSSEFAQYGLLPPSGIIPINTDGTFFETVHLATSFSGPQQQIQVTLNPFDIPAATFDVFDLVLQLLGEVSTNVQVGLLEPGHIQQINDEIRAEGDFIKVINDFVGLLHAVVQHSTNVLGASSAFVIDLLKLFATKSNLARLVRILTLIVGPAVPGIATTLASYASGLHAFLVILKLTKFLADWALALGSYLFQNDTFPTVILQTDASVTPTSTLTATASPTRIPTPTLTSTVSPTPIPTSPPPTLSVSPSSRVNNFQGCSTETHGGSGYLISCPFVLSNSTQTTSALNWSASANNPRVIFDHSSGTLAPGQSITINAEMYGNGNGSVACPGINMTLVFKGSINTIQVPLICTVIGTNPDAYSFDNTYCSHTGNWVCIITVGAFSQNTMNTPWAATVQTPDPKITFSPTQGTLAPSATVQVTITIPSSDCPGNNTFFFYVPGGLPNGGNYLQWSC